MALKVCLGLVWRREDKREEREINKTEENRSINISAAAPVADFSWSHERWRERERTGRGIDKVREGERTGVIVLQSYSQRVKERDGEWG